MIGMNFQAFLTLLILGLLSSFVLHVLIRYRMMAGVDGFLCEWIAGWMEAWLGSPVLGHWSLQREGVYFIPALLDTFVAAAPRQAVVPPPVASPQFEMRKAG